MLLHGQPVAACGGGYVLHETVMESGLGVVVSVDRAGGAVTLDHEGTPYVLKAGRTRFAASAPGVLDEASAAEGKHVRFELVIMDGNIAITRIERTPE